MKWSWADYVEAPDRLVTALEVLLNASPDEDTAPGMQKDIADWKREKKADSRLTSLPMETNSG